MNIQIEQAAGHSLLAALPALNSSLAIGHNPVVPFLLCQTTKMASLHKDRKKTKKQNRLFQTVAAESPPPPPCALVLFSPPSPDRLPVLTWCELHWGGGVGCGDEPDFEFSHCNPRVLQDYDSAGVINYGGSSGLKCDDKWAFLLSFLCAPRFREKKVNHLKLLKMPKTFCS